jgi:hypothetical protein
MMDEVIGRLQREAERIAAKHRVPEFYVRFQAPVALARRLFYNDPELIRLRNTVRPELQEDMGHGLFHSTRVSLDASTLICVELESERVSKERLERLMVLGVVAGLLHDIRREDENHAEAGAVEAERILQGFSLSGDEIGCVSQAIRNHEAFRESVDCGAPWRQLISDCLYDADKFRWGPDTFTHTLWHMVDHKNITPQELIERFPWGMTGILRISETFRTNTGRQFGPDIIDVGVEIGKEIYRYLLQHFRGETNE